MIGRGFIVSVVIVTRIDSLILVQFISKLCIMRVLLKIIQLLNTSTSCKGSTGYEV